MIYCEFLNDLGNLVLIQWMPMYSATSDQGQLLCPTHRGKQTSHQKMTKNDTTKAVPKKRKWQTTPPKKEPKVKSTEWILLAAVRVYLVSITLRSSCSPKYRKLIKSASPPIPCPRPVHKSTSRCSRRAKSTDSRIGKARFKDSGQQFPHIG